jgi:PAS domain S-box-containing protein
MSVGTIYSEERAPGLDTGLDDVLAHSLIEAAPDALVLVGGDGRIVFVNAPCEALFGYARGDLIGKTVEVLVPEAVRAQHRVDRAAFTEAPHPRAMGVGRALSGRRRDGTEFPVEVSLSPVRSPRGLFIAAAVRDVSERDRVRRALGDLEERHRVAVDLAPIGMALISLDGRLLSANRSVCRITGYSREELASKTFQDITHPQDVEAEVALVAKLRSGEVERYQMPKRLIRKDGGVVHALASRSLVRDAAGAPLYFIGQIEDVTDRVLAEEALKRNQKALERSEARLARAQRIAGLGSWEWDLATGEVTRSAELLALFGLEPGAVSPRAWSTLDYIHPDDREWVRRAVEEASRDGRAYVFEHRIVRTDGSERMVLHQGQPVLEDGRVVGMVGTYLDITERKRAEREREETLQWLRAVLDRIPVAVLLVHGAHGERVEANRRTQVLLGTSIERLGEDPDRVLDTEGRRLRLEELPSMRALRGEHVDGAEYLMRHTSGALVPVRQSAVPIVDAQGKVQGAVVAILDITAAKELERLRAEWGSVVAHDLRQPINTIVVSAQMVARMGDDPKLRARLVGNMQAAARRLDRMVGDLMDLSRLEARRLDLLRQPTDLLAVVRSSVERVAPNAPDRRLDVVVHGEIPAAYADSDRVAQVVENLLSNAVKYGATATPILIEVAHGQGELSVAVTNQGEGIPPEQIPRLFQRFQRCEGAKSSGLKGTGLGLYITRELVEAHGGRIMVESTPGATTTFRFTLPVA